MASFTLDDLMEHLEHSPGTPEPLSSDDPLTPERVSRMTAHALAADLEYWARQTAVDGQVGLNDLVRVLDVVREDAAVDLERC